MCIRDSNLLFTGTNNERDTESISDLSEKQKSFENSYPDINIEMLNRRPEMNPLIHKAIENSQNDITFISCGPSSFLDTVRYNIKEEMKNAKVDVSLQEESFTW